MKTRAKYLLSPWFTGALLLLICNDLWWKAAYSNTLTGKLSDFSGVLVLGLLFNFFSERNRSLNALFVIVFFTFWKSPLSEGLIVSWNTLGFFPVERVVDYSDLLAFAVLPIVSHLPFPERAFRPLPITALLFCSAFALASTSRVRSYSGWQFIDLRQVLSFRTSLTADEFYAALQTDLQLYATRKDSVTLDGMRLPLTFLTYQGESSTGLIDSAEIIVIQHKPTSLQVHVISAYLHPGKSIMEVKRLENYEYAYGIHKVRVWEATVNRE